MAATPTNAQSGSPGPVMDRDVVGEVFSRPARDESVDKGCMLGEEEGGQAGRRQAIVTQRWHWRREEEGRRRRPGPAAPPHDRPPMRR
jgi:hypothetical protein